MERRRLRIVVCAVVASLVATAAPLAARADDGDWYAETGVLFVTRDTEEGETLVRVGGVGVFDSAEDLEFGFEPGVYATVGKRLTERTAVEVGVFWLRFHESDGIASAAPGNLDVFPQQGAVNQLDDAVLVRVSYKSDLLSLEANVTCEVTESLSAYAGVRYLSLEEELNIYGTDNGATSTYAIDTENHLLGGHGGVEFAHALGDRWTVGGRVGGGIFANLAEQDQTVDDNGAAVTFRDEDDEETAFAWIVEAAASARVQLTDRVHLEGGYGLLYIDGVALAPEQFDVSALAPGTTVDSDGHALYHGGFFGVGVIF